MADSGKHVGTMPAGVLGAVTTGDQRAESVGPLKFWSPRDPWEVLKCDDGGLIVCSKGDVICHSDRNHGRDDPADLALFPLLATAPKLLAALQAVLRTNERWGLTRARKDAYNAAVDAIREATTPVSHEPGA